MHDGIIHNNISEGYNSKNNKDVGGNPNPYTYCAHIKEQLLVGIDEALTVRVGNANERPKEKKFRKLKKMRDDLMKQLEKGDTDLETFIKSIGSCSLEYDKRIKSDAKAEAIKHSDSNQKDIVEEEDTEMVPPSQISSLIDQDLRRFAFSLPEDLAADLMNLQEGLPIAKETLKRHNFVMSPSQPQTKGDGNCFCHALTDQMMYDEKLKKMNWDEHKARSQVIASAEMIIYSKDLEWPGEYSIDDWKATMARDGTYVDATFLQIAAELLSRKIVLILCHHEDGDNNSGTRVIEPRALNGESLYFLYYPESRFASPHYQSIRPVQEESAEQLQSLPENSECFVPPIESTAIENKVSKKRKKQTDSSTDMFQSTGSNSKSSKKSWLNESSIIKPTARKRTTRATSKPTKKNWLDDSSIIEGKRTRTTTRTSKYF